MPATQTTSGVACPICQGPTYDNRAENDARLAKGEKLRPDHKCRNRSCDGAVWRAKPGAPPPPAATPYVAPIPAMVPMAQPVTPHTPPGFIDIAMTYEATLAHVLANVVPTFVARGIPVTMEGIAAIAAHLNITRSQKGV
jgi:hypothetical protein